MSESSKISSLKAFLYVFTFLLTLGGITLFGLGIWSIVELQRISGIFSGNVFLFNSSYISIVAGGMSFLIGFVATFGIYNENKTIMQVFVCLLIIFLMLEIAAVAIAFVFVDDFDQFVTTDALLSIQAEYGTVATNNGLAVTAAWDITQTTLKCCGFYNGLDYNGSYFQAINDNANPWPASCCAIDDCGGYTNYLSCISDEPDNLSITHALVGCATKVKSVVAVYSLVLGGFGAAMLVLQLLALMLAAYVGRRL